MSALPVERKRPSPFELLSRWWQGWTEGISQSADHACGAEAEVERVARDLGVSAIELRSLAQRGPESADLLLRRMKEFNLDPKEVARVEPATLHDLQRVCTLCKDHRRCAKDLAHDPSNPHWQDYCPNVMTLKALDAMPWSARGEW